MTYKPHIKYNRPFFSLDSWRTAWISVSHCQTVTNWTLNEQEVCFYVLSASNFKDRLLLYVMNEMSAETLTPLPLPHIKCDGIRWWGLWEVIRFKWALMNGISGLTRVTREQFSPLCCLPCENTRSPKSKIWKSTLIRTWPHGTLISDLQPPELWEIKFLLFISHPDYIFAIVAQLRP